MRNYTLSREQSLALETIGGNKLSAILFLDKLNLATTLLHSIEKDLTAGKRSILFIESPELFDTLKEKISTSALKSMCLFLDQDDYLSEQDLARIRTMTKDSREDLKLYEDVNERYEAKSQRIYDVFNDQACKIFGERRWRDLVLLPRRTDKVLNTFKYQFNLNLNQQEFWYIRGLIEEAKSLYDKGHLISDQIASTFNISIDSEEKISNLRQDLIRFKERLESVINELDLELYNYKARIYTKLEEEYVEISTFIEKASLLFSKSQGIPQQPIVSSFNLFNKKHDVVKHITDEFLEIRDQINKSILINASVNQQQWTLTDIEVEIARWKSQLANWRKSREMITLKMIMSLNKNNCETGNFKEIDRKISQLFEGINELGIFKENLENTSLNTYNQYVSADNWLSHIKLCLSYLNENKEIIIWENFYGNLPDNARYLVDALKKFEIKEWIPLYEKWYLDKLLEKHFNPDTIIIDRLLEDYNSLSSDYYKAFPNYIDSKFHSSRTSTLESLRNRNKDTYNKLIKKKNVDDLRIFDLVWSEKQMISYFFPVMIVSSKLLRSNRLLKDGSWDQVYCERTEIFTHIEKFTLLDQKVCFFSPLAESFKICNDLNIKIDDKKQLCKLLIHEYNFDQPVSELPLSDRLRAAKKLSKILLSLNQNVSIFQMRNANIISILPETLNDSMVEIFDANGIKEIIAEDSLYETVTESVIAIDRNQYLLHQDQLLSYDHVDSCMWQLEAIDSFRSCGFKIINVNTLKYRNNPEYFTSLLNEYIPLGTQEEENLLPKEA